MSGVNVKREKLLAEIASGRGRSIRIRLVEYENVPGGPRLDIRQFYVDEAGQSLPSSKGCGLRAESLPQLRQALDEFEQEAAKGKRG
jgi:hypothetical protein